MSHRAKRSTHQPATPASPDAGTAVAADLAALQADAETLRHGWQRTQADFDNFRRRTVAEQQDRVVTAVGQALLNLTPVAENLRRAIDQLEKLTGAADSVEGWRAWANGITSIARQFDQALTVAGLTLIDPAPGTPFTPHEHEALAHQPHADHEHDTIVQVVERGYRVGQRILVPAKVIVSAGLIETTSETSV